MNHIVSFSGGKDSTAMLFKMIETGMPIDRIICVDTTKEFPGMYAHIQQVQDRIPYKIDILKIDFDYYFGRHVKKNGTVGYGWCDHINRWCTALKRDTIKRFISSLGYRKEEIVHYHGIALDESHRAGRNASKEKNISYPLIEMGMSEEDCLKYCYSLGFTWGGLYEEGRKRVSCFCCPLQDLEGLRLTYKKHPDLWKKILEMDKLSFRKFKSTYTVSELDEKFAYESIHGKIRGKVRK